MMKKIVNKKSKIFIKFFCNAICLILCISQVIFLFSPTILAASSDLRNSTYAVDPDTTDDYITHMINEKNGSRYAGRIWSDKSVFREGITLDNDTDGYNGTVTNNSDFLHVFSVLGSSQKINEDINAPIDAVFLIDMSGSMAIDIEETGKIKVTALNDFSNESNTVVVTNAFNEELPSNWEMFKIKYSSTAYNFEVEEIKRVNENTSITKPTVAGEMIIAIKNPTEEWKKIEKGDLLTGSSTTGLTLSSNTVTNISDGAYFTHYKGHKDMDERISHSRIYKVVEAINNTIDTLMELNETNRVTVVGYGGSAAVILPLGHYEKTGDQNYISVEGFTNYSKNTLEKNNLNSASYNVIGHATKTDNNENEIVNNKIRNDYAKDGFEDTKIIGYHTNLQAGIYLGFEELYKNLKTSDDVTYTYHSKLQNKETTIPRIPAAFVMTDGGSNYALKNADNLETTGDEWHSVPILDSITAYEGNYQKYRAETDKNNDVDGGEVPILDILLTTAYMKAKVQNKYTELLKEENLLQGNEKAKFYIQSITVDTPTTTWQIPRIYAALDPKDFFNDTLLPVDNIDPNTWAQKEDVITSYKYFEKWVQSETGIEIEYKDSDKKAIKVKFNKLNEETEEVTNQDVIDNIYYNDDFFDIGTANLTDTFHSFVSKISEVAFVPVGGINEYGGNDSLTYMDPIGKYMEVKDDAITIGNETYDMAMLLFGEMYGIEKKAVYDYSFNKNHLTNGKFEAGWYDSKGQKKDKGNWDNGDAYYLNEEEIKYFVNDDNAISDIDKKYFIYRFVDADTEGIKRKLNESYSESAQIYYKLNDIQILVEQAENGDEKLFVNIPASALPLQTVTIQADETDSGLKYSTNLDNKEASTPLRLFYNVGVADAIKMNDGKDIDLDKIDKEYLKKYTSEDDYLSFFSNYYSETTYDGYTADTQDDARTKGDAVLSISPSMDNRYYVFQKNLKLYQHAYIIGKDGQVEEEHNPLNFEGADFDGVYDGKTEGNKPNDEGLKSIQEVFERNELNEGDIIFLSGDTVSYGTEPSSDAFYYFAIDYFMPTEDGKGKQVQYVVARKGSEFGSGIAENPGAKLPKGDFLSWIDVTGQNQKTYNFEDNIPEDIESSSNWVLATKIGGLRIGDLHQSILRKKENKTGTSKSYYLPIIADDPSTIGSDAILDAYLGNNGLLTYKIEKWAIPDAGSIGMIATTIIGITLIIISSLLYKKRKRGFMKDDTS